MKKRITIKRFIIVHTKVFIFLIKKYPVSSILMILFMLLTAAASVVSIQFTEYSTDAAVALYNGSAELQKTLWIFAAFAAAFLATVVLNWLNGRITLKFREKVRFEIETSFKMKLSAIPYDFFESNAFHEKLSRAGQTGELYANAIQSIVSFIRLLFMMGIYSILLSRVSSWFPLIVIAANIVTILISGFVTDRQLAYWRRHVMPKSRRNSYFEGVMGDRVSQQTIQSGRLYAFFAARCHKWNRATTYSYARLNFLSFFTDMAVLVIQCAVCIWAMLHVGNLVVTRPDTYGVGYFTMVVTLLFSLFSMMKSFANVVVNGNWHVATLDDYYELMALPELPSETQETDASIFKALAIDQIAYRYKQSANYALKGVSAVFRRGERIAVVGPNGSGKSTLMSILSGLFTDYEGNMQLSAEDGRPLSRVSVSCLLQEFCRYQMTIRENIEIGNSGQPLPEETLQEIIKKVELTDFISSLKEGMNTPLGQLAENGRELSAGQWQKLAAARLLAVPNAQIWILDEPTAHLDPIAEIEMYKFIYALASDQWVFFVSHRLGFARWADRILVLDEGQIAEEGTHQELLEAGGLYARMYDAQKIWMEA